MSAAAHAKFTAAVGPMPQLTNFGAPTDEDLALWAGYMQRVANSTTAGDLSSYGYAVGRLQACTKQLTIWLADRSCELEVVKRERDQYKLAAETNAATIRAMIELRGAADEALP